MEKYTKLNIKTTLKDFMNENTGNYEPDYDNILQIMKTKYGYGDLSSNYFEEFENKKKLKLSSDADYADKLNDYINKFGNK